MVEIVDRGSWMEETDGTGRPIPLWEIADDAALIEVVVGELGWAGAVAEDGLGIHAYAGRHDLEHAIHLFPEVEMVSLLLILNPVDATVFQHDFAFASVISSAYPLAPLLEPEGNASGFALSGEGMDVEGMGGAGVLAGFSADHHPIDGLTIVDF